MKYKVIITLLMVLFVGSVGNAQAFRDNNNMLLGKVESDGTVRNANNMRLGKIFDDGTIMLVLTEQYEITTMFVLVLSALMAQYVTITI